MILHPLVEITDGITEGTTRRLRVEEGIRIRYAAVEGVVGDNLRAVGEQIQLQEDLDISPVLALVRVHKDEIKFLGRRQILQRIECGTGHDVETRGRITASAGIGGSEALLDPSLEKRVDLEGYDTGRGAAFEHGSCAVASKHADLQNTPGLLHGGHRLDHLRLERVRAHLLSVREHGATGLPLLLPVCFHHLFPHGAHGRTLETAHVHTVLLHTDADGGRFQQQALDALAQHAPSGARAVVRARSTTRVCIHFLRLGVGPAESSDVFRHDRVVVV
mmetsp:Transcript_28004/g.56126  ORF Transcript_28004/g.56126 Transcript_28004/m.56126 type:complete len:276 (+) Transcript_28004:56-883(+)